MAVWAGFLFRSTTGAAVGGGRSSAGEYRVTPGARLPSYSEPGLHDIQRRLNLPFRLVFASTQIEKEVGEPDVGDWDLYPNERIDFEKFCLKVAEDLIQESEELYFFFAEEEWSSDDRYLLRVGNIDSFGAEFNQIYPWSICVVGRDGGKVRERPFPVLFHLTK